MSSIPARLSGAARLARACPPVSSAQRYFASSAGAHRAFKTPAVDQSKLMTALHHSCQWGAAHPWGDHATETGMRRLSLDDNDKLAREWFSDECLRLGCSEVVVDQMGNQFAIRPGTDDGPPTAMGSHLDTQPTGGRYDGILGVLAGLEALRVLDTTSTRTRYPICLVNWTNEEGARFPQSVVSSSVWAGLIPLEDAWNLREIAGLAAQPDKLRNMKEELERIGFLGQRPCSWEAMPLKAHFELHIEQGPILEAQNKSIAVVTGGQAYRWRTLTIKGRDAHTGSTPYEGRADALQAAAKMLIETKRLAQAAKGLCTTGVLSLQPSSTNTIPGLVKMTLDTRHPSTSSLAKLDADILEACKRIAAEEGGCELQYSLDSDVEAVQFHDDCIAAIEEAAEERVGKDGYLRLRSGAGHDTFATSKRCPSAMIFARSRQGISHNPREYTTPEDCADGAAVLLGAVLRFDAARTS